MYKLQRRAEEGESDGAYRLLECLVRLVWRSDELALPIKLLVLASEEVAERNLLELV
jgi:hypothetical protein